jgi:hypothetical protein
LNVQFVTNKACQTTVSPSKSLNQLPACHHLEVTVNDALKVFWQKPRLQKVCKMLDWFAKRHFARENFIGVGGIARIVFQ